MDAKLKLDIYKKIVLSRRLGRVPRFACRTLCVHLAFLADSR